MKIKTLVAMLFLSAGATTVVAQDASNCNSNSSISHEAVRAGNFKDAYTPWKAVLENCPTLRFYTFTDGYKILKGLMGQIKDRNNADYQKYFNELMNTHDLRIKYTDEFLAKGTKVSSADEALGIKAVDYIAFAPKIDVNQAYQWLSQSVNAVKGESAGATIFYFLQMSLDKLKTDPNHKDSVSSTASPQNVSRFFRKMPESVSAFTAPPRSMMFIASRWYHASRRCVTKLW